VADLHWFDALVRYKQGAIMALINRNARKRGQSDPMGSCRNLLDSASALLGTR
jgi:hypothetical protein